MNPRLMTETQKAAITKTPATNVMGRAQWHSVIIEPPEHVPEMKTCDKLNPVWWLKNSDEPEPPVWYRPDDKHRDTKWFFRNPFHNFGFYVIGIVGKEFVRSGRYPEHLGNPNGGWNFSISKYKLLRLPMVSYNRRRIDFYFGWRTHGNFGMKFNIHSPRKKPTTNEKETYFTWPSESSDFAASGP